MALIGKKKSQRQHEAEQQEAENAARQRALRLVDTRGVVVGEAEAELQAAIALQRTKSTPEREERVAEAKRALAEAKRALAEARSR